MPLEDLKLSAQSFLLLWIDTPGLTEKRGGGANKMMLPTNTTSRSGNSRYETGHRVSTTVTAAAGWSCGRYFSIHPLFILSMLYANEATLLNRDSIENV